MAKATAAVIIDEGNEGADLAVVPEGQRHLVDASGATLLEQSVETGDIFWALPGTRYDGADFAGADLRGTQLSKATLVETRLHGADLTGADLIGADLTNADLTNADLANADLDSARLQGLQGGDEVLGLDSARNLSKALTD